MHAESLKQSMRALIGLAGVLAFVACSATDSTTTMPSANPLLKPGPGPTASVILVTATATVGGQSAVGDTVFLDIANNGNATVYFPRCGTEPLVLTQELVNGVWVGGVQNFACLNTGTTATSIPLSPGAHIKLSRIFAASGEFRFVLNCATVPDLKDTSPCISSNPFDVLVQTLPAGGPVLTAKVGGRGASGDTVFVDVANLGTTSAFIERCGDDPLVLTQQFSNGVWTGGIENISCVASTEPGPVKVAPGAHLLVVRVFASPGQFRFLARVAKLPDLSDAAPVTSNSVDITP
jgi:hypothetical protein